MKKTLFIKNAIILTASSLLLRFIGIVFKVWLAQKIGSEGIGLYQLVFSVYVLASTFAMSGTSTAVTRLVSEELAVGNHNNISKILRRAMQLSLIIALFSVLILFFGADFIGKVILSDQRTIAPLKILPLSLPFIGITSCMRGYFIARRNATPNALTQIFEQVIRITIIFLLVDKFISRGISTCCFVVILGDAVAEIVSCLCLYLIYSKDKHSLCRKNEKKGKPLPIVRRILHISVPITSGRYLNSLLRTAENILVPKNLAKYPANTNSALSQFGMIKGMALPVLFFPSAILNAVSTLLIPEISEAAALKKDNVVKSACERIFKITIIIGLLFGAIFFSAGKELALLIYKDDKVGMLLQALAPIVPLMYLDSICDGILKGLDQQSFSFRTAVSDSSIRLVLIILLLPRLGLNGFIIIMYFSNFLTCFLNVGRLQKISGAGLGLIKTIFAPCTIAVAVTSLTKFLLSRIDNCTLAWYCIFFCLFSCAVYFCILFILKLVKKEDFLR